MSCVWLSSKMFVGGAPALPGCSGVGVVASDASTLSRFPPSSKRLSTRWLATERGTTTLCGHLFPASSFESSASSKGGSRTHARRQKADCDF